VGGAVRDRLLGIQVVDRDWVVVGTTPQAMIEAGYLPVGENFPVFLHPTTKEEYALARTERKTGQGYHGFTFHASPDVTLEQDLARRDLTINALAENADGEIIDPFNGRADLDARVLRHVSPAFNEDPVRVLRAARLLARFAQLDFTLAPDTLNLMQSMVTNGEVDTLVAERVWQETDKALSACRPRLFFEALRKCGALAVVFPELDALFGVPQLDRSLTEVDTGRHVLMTLDRACESSSDKALRFAALCHDIGKADTPQAKWPEHLGYEKLGAAKCALMCKRLRTPSEFRDLATLTAKHHTCVHGVFDLDANSLVNLLASLDVIRKRERLERFLLICAADAVVSSGLQACDYPQAGYVSAAADAYTQVDAGAIARLEQDPQLIAQKIQQARIAALTSFIDKHDSAT